MGERGSDGRGVGVLHTPQRKCLVWPVRGGRVGSLQGGGQEGMSLDIVVGWWRRVWEVEVGVEQEEIRMLAGRQYAVGYS